jgi:hypothetical protein
MERNRVSVFSIVLYVLGGLVLIYAIWAAYVSYGIISTAIEQGQLVVSRNQFEIANFLVSSFGQYAIFAVILLALGRLLQVNSYSRVDDYDSEDEVDTSEELADEEVEERVEIEDN